MKRTSDLNNKSVTSTKRKICSRLMSVIVFFSDCISSSVIAESYLNPFNLDYTSIYSTLSLFVMEIPIFALIFSVESSFHLRFVVLSSSLVTSLTSFGDRTFSSSSSFHIGKNLPSSGEIH